MNAIISGRMAMGLIREGDHFIVLRVGEDDENVASTENLRPWFDNAGDLITVEATTREQVREALTLAVASTDALDVALILLDPELSNETRAQAADDLEGIFLAHPASQERLERVLWAAPLPNELDLSGALRLTATHHKAQAMLVRFGERQSAIQEVRAAWDAIPTALFEPTDSRHEVLVALVREGAFRGLVNARAEGADVNAVFAQLLLVSAVRKIRNYRELLGQWIKLLRKQPTASTQQLNDPWLDDTKEVA